MCIARLLPPMTVMTFHENSMIFTRYIVVYAMLVALDVQKAQIAYHEVDGSLFAKYIEEKANPIIGVLEQNMYIRKFDWAQCSAPTGNDR